jgi:predicted nucleic acid-binding Zn ribbon protein
VVYLFECKECGTESEIECKMAERSEQFCPFCDAPPEKMKQLINTHFDKNVTWSQWRVDVGT